MSSALKKIYVFLTNSYESIKQATPRPSPSLPVSSRVPRGPCTGWLHFRAHPSFRVTAVIQIHGRADIERRIGAKYTRQLRSDSVMPLDLRWFQPVILIGNFQRNLFPVRASSGTVLLWALWSLSVVFNEANASNKLPAGRMPTFCSGAVISTDGYQC